MPTLMKDHPATNSNTTTVFAIGLIWRKLGQCLSHPDLKVFRLVNKQFNYCILNETNFTRRTLLTLEQKQVNPASFGRTTHRWLHFRLPYWSHVTAGEKGKTKEEQEDSLSWLYPLLCSAESIELRISTRFADLPSINKLLEAPDPSHLKTFAVQASVLYCPATPNYLSRLKGGLSFRARKNLENLQEFQLLSETYPGSQQKNEDLKEFYNHCSITESRRKIWNGHFKESTDLLKDCLKNLRTVKIESLTGPYHYDAEDGSFLVHPSSDSWHYQSVMEMIQQNRQTLEKLDVQHDLFWNRGTSYYLRESIPTLLKVHFPCLKRLRVVPSPSCRTTTENLPTFLSKQPPLEQLSVTIKQTSKQLLASILEQSSSSLKGFGLATQGFERCGEFTLKFFLQGLDSLEEFELILIPIISSPPEADDDYNEQIQNDGQGQGQGHDHLRLNIDPRPLSICTIFSALPPSLRKISLANHVFDDSQTWGLIGTLKDFDFTGSNLNPRLVNQLSLVNIYRAVDDSALEFISTNWESLERLSLRGSAQGLSSQGLATFRKMAAAKNSKNSKSSPVFSLEDESGYSLSLPCCLIAFGIAFGLFYYLRRRNSSK